MDEEYIVSLAEAHAKDGLLTYEDFDHIFGELFERREQYVICEILYECGIELVPADEVIEKLEAPIDKPTNMIEPVFVNKKVKQSNELLCKLIQEGNQQAKQDLCVKNENLVTKYAIGYSKFWGNDLTVDDLKQAGMIGLLEAAARFDPAIGCSFSTYAVIWIKQAITREIYDKGFRVRIPVHLFERINKINQLDKKFFLSGETDYNLRLNKIAMSMEMSLEHLKELILFRDTYMNNISLDMPVNEKGDTTLMELIPIEEEVSLEDKVIRLEMKEVLEKVLSTLTPREIKILRLRFGFDDDRNRTLEEVGQSFGLTRERIRQIEAKALRKLRHPSRSRRLADFRS